MKSQGPGIHQRKLVQREEPSTWIQCCFCCSCDSGARVCCHQGFFPGSMLRDYIWQSLRVWGLGMKFNSAECKASRQTLWTLSLGLRSQYLPTSMEPWFLLHASLYPHMRNSHILVMPANSLCWVETWNIIRLPFIKFRFKHDFWCWHFLKIHPCWMTENFLKTLCIMG